MPAMRLAVTNINSGLRAPAPSRRGAIGAGWWQNDIDRRGTARACLPYPEGKSANVPPESRTVVFGAFDRHNLGDLLSAHVVAVAVDSRRRHQGGNLVDQCERGQHQGAGSVGARFGDVVEQMLGIVLVQMLEGERRAGAVAQ